MIAVRETKPGVFEPIVGNPVLLSLDGKVKAPLLTILAPSWSEADRAKFGVYTVEPFVVPEGKQVTGLPRYEKVDGGIVQVGDLEDIPAPAEPLPNPLDELRSDLEALAARVLALEGAKA
jgi:hypothetical protein